MATIEIDPLQKKVQEVLSRCQSPDTPKAAKEAARHILELTYLAGLSMSQLEGITVENYREFLEELFSQSLNPDFWNRNFGLVLEDYCHEGSVVKKGDILNSIELAIALIAVLSAEKTVRIVEQAKKLLESRFPLNLEGYSGRIVRSPYGQTDIILSHPVWADITANKQESPLLPAGG